MPELGWEKRKSPRKDVFGNAVIIAPGIRMDCVIRDLSATGAKLEVAGDIRLPNEFDVVLLKTNSTRRVSLRWRHGNFAGVQFHPRSETAPSPAPGLKSSWRWHR